MWEYNGKLYKNKQEMRELLGWTRTKWKAKMQDGKIKLINEEPRLNENLHNNPDRSK